MKMVPAGVSKSSGRPYNAFEACSNRQCTFKPARAQTRPSYGQPAPTPQIGVAADMLNELKEIKAILLKLAFQKPAPVQVDGPANPQDELGPDEEIPF